MQPNSLLGPNWKNEVGKPIGELTFDTVLNNDPSHGIILVTDTQYKTRYVMIPADRFDSVLQNCETLQGIWSEFYTPSQDTAQRRVT